MRREAGLEHVQTVSIGVTAFEAAIPDRTALEFVDELLYAAKQNGRNRVIGRAYEPIEDVSG